MPFVPDPAERTVRIPIEIRQGRVEFYFGGGLPKLREGALGELIVSAWAILDEKMRKKLLEDRSVPILKKGTSIYVQLSRNAIDVEGSQSLVWDKAPPLGEHLMAEVRLLDTLLLKMRGTKQPSLEEVRCEIPALDGSKADSVNHAYTRLSEHFEPHRRSHTANVFDKVFIKDPKGKYRPLRHLREDREALHEARFGAENQPPKRSPASS
jgi:hypothetical protein